MTRRRRDRREHDPEETVRAGMSTEASGVDEAETMASTGDEESAFRLIASGTATGLGIDRAGTLASGQDRDELDPRDRDRSERDEER